MDKGPDRILVVDDDALLCRTVSVYLAERGFDCRRAHGGAEGLKRFRDEPPDLILLDIRMPEMSGPEVLEVVVRESPETPVIVISATGDMEDVVAVLRRGAWDYLMKPITEMSILEHAVRRALERAQLLQDNRRYRERLEAEVRERTRELQEANEALGRKNAALEELMAQIQARDNEVGRSVVSSVEKVALPMLHAHKQGLSPRQQEAVSQIEQSLEEITSPFVDRLSKARESLTPTEIRLCSLIRRGLGSKEVARLESISVDTVGAHRRNIRRKLGLAGKKINLVSHLQTLFP